MSARKSKKIDSQYVSNAAFYYLGRFNSTEANLRKVLERKIIKRRGVSEEHGYSLNDDEHRLIEDAVRKCHSYGYLNDQRYAEDRAQTLLHRGKPLRQIGADLKQKGVGDDVLSAVLANLDQSAPDTDRFAAARYAKRRRFGAFKSARTEDISDVDEKQLAAMARAGFSYETAKEILSADLDILHEILESAELS
jgi:regulatory protein